MYQARSYLRPVLAALTAACSVTLAIFTEAAEYQDYVKSLSPNFYFELNETDEDGGVLDSVSGEELGSYNVDFNFPAFTELGVPGPDFLIEGGAWTTNDVWTTVGDDVQITGLGDDNGAFAANDEGHIDLGPSTNYGANSMTVALFALSGGNPQGGERIFTNNLADPTQSFQIVVGNDGIVVSTNPTIGCDAGGCGHKSLFLPGEGGDGFSGEGADRGLANMPDNDWWHIVASTEGTTAEERAENIRLWLNGVDRTEDFKPGTTGWGVDTDQAKIAGRRADPFDSTTYSGTVDEVSIWLDRVLTDTEARNLYLTAIGEDPMTGGGDFNGDGTVDGADFLLWQQDQSVGALADWEATFGSTSASPNVGAVPEPTSVALVTVAALSSLAMVRGRQR
ncbi:MAG: hypothetical protein AAGA03_20185 [Planctomycetota bacterium]